jgi:uncharacterized protein YdcH (DUF465 family)
MSIVGQSSAVAADGLAYARTAIDHLDAHVSHPMIVEALGQKTVDELLASAHDVADGAFAAAEALQASVDMDAVTRKADALMERHDDESQVTDYGGVPDAIDLGKLRDATAQFQKVLGKADKLADDVERVVERARGDEQIRSRLRQEFAAEDEDADLEAVKGALASVNPDNVAIAGVLSGVTDQVAAAGKDVPPDVQEAVRHLEDSLNESRKDLSRLVERARDISIAAVDALS